MRNTIKNIKANNFTTFLFLFFMNSSFVFQMSQIYENEFGKLFSTFFAILGIVFLFLHLLMDSVIPLKWFFGTIILVIIGLLAYAKSGSPTIIKLIMFFYAVNKVDRVKVLKWFILSLLVPFSFVAISSILGFTNIQFEGQKNALAFGMINPNTVPVIIFAVIVAYNLYNENNIKTSTLLSEAFISWLVYYFCRARTAGLVLLLYLFLLFINKAWGKKKFILNILWLFQFFFPICALITLALTVLFGSRTSFWLLMNNLSSGRLVAWNYYFNTYGISIFGSSIDFNRGALDNAYMMLLLKYGIISFITYLILFTFVSIYSYKKRLLVLFVSVLATEVYCIAEFGPMLINFCPVLLYLACIIINRNHDNCNERINSFG